MLESSKCNFILFLHSHCSEWLGHINRSLVGFNVALVLLINVWYEGILVWFNASHLLVTSLRVGNMFNISHWLSQGTSLFIVVLLSLTSEREISWDYSTSECGLSVGFNVDSLVTTRSTWGLGSASLRLSVISSPTLIEFFVLSSITLEVPSSIHHLRKVHIIINTGTNVGIVLQEFDGCHVIISLVVVQNIVMSLEGL